MLGARLLAQRALAGGMPFRATHTLRQCATLQPAWLKTTFAGNLWTAIMVLVLVLALAQHQRQPKRRRKTRQPSSRLRRCATQAVSMVCGCKVKSRAWRQQAASTAGTTVWQAGNADRSDVLTQTDRQYRAGFQLGASTLLNMMRATLLAPKCRAEAFSTRMHAGVMHGAILLACSVLAVIHSRRVALTRRKHARKQQATIATWRQLGCAVQPLAVLAVMTIPMAVTAAVVRCRPRRPVPSQTPQSPPPPLPPNQSICRQFALKPAVPSANPQRVACMHGTTT